MQNRLPYNIQLYIYLYSMSHMHLPCCALLCLVYSSVTGRCCYNMVKYNMILDTTLQWLRLKLKQSFNLQKTPHISPWRVSYGLSFVRILEKIDCIIMAPHCIKYSWDLFTHMHQNCFTGSEHVVSSTHWGRDKMAAVSPTTLSNAFSWMKILEFRLKFHWSLFLRVQLTIIQHWFR